MAVQNARHLLGVRGFLWAVDLGSRSGLIGLITLDVNCAGARSAGNPLATCDVAGAGNQLTVRIVRHSQRKRGATDRPNLRSKGASPRPYRDPHPELPIFSITTITCGCFDCVLVLIQDLKEWAKWHKEHWHQRFPLRMKQYLQRKPAGFSLHACRRQSRSGSACSTIRQKEQ